MRHFSLPVITYFFICCSCDFAVASIIGDYDNTSVKAVASDDVDRGEETTLSEDNSAQTYGSADMQFSKTLDGIVRAWLFWTVPAACSNLIYWHLSVENPLSRPLLRPS